jgi:hypothetical protein
MTLAATISSMKSKQRGPLVRAARPHAIIPTRRSSRSAPEQDEQNDDRQRDSNQPQQRTLSDTHHNSPLTLVGTTHELRRKFQITGE